MITYQQALYILKSIAKKLDYLSYETVNTVDSQNKYLAKSITSEVNVPPFDNSTMDGFALNNKHLQANVSHYKVEVIGSIQAGDSGQLDPSSTKPQACEIMTGAPLPENFEAVIPIEKVTVNITGGKNHITFQGIIRAGGQHIKTTITSVY